MALLAFINRYRDLLFPLAIIACLVVIVVPLPQPCSIAFGRQHCDRRRHPAYDDLRQITARIQRFPRPAGRDRP